MADLLYSTNVALKLRIQQTYQADVHYVWCSDMFDSRTAGHYNRFSTPPSSSPSDIYQELHKAVKGHDRHSSKITEQKLGLKNLAAAWLASGVVTDTQAQEIVYMTDNSEFDDWKPLLYVIPRAPVDARMELVPIAKRAGFGEEWIIKDLKRHEFDIIEFVCP